MERVGVLLVNLGTPDAPTSRDVRRYLREFLGDPRVLDMHPAARWLLLNLVILPIRPRRSAEAYRKIWLPEGSPLLLHSRALREGVAARLGPDYEVALGMRYGTPSIADAIGELSASGVSRVIALPLFPQSSDAVTGSILARVRECVAAADRDLELVEIRDFFDDAGFIEAVAGAARERLKDFDADHILFSYHGLPEFHLTRDDEHDVCLRQPDCCDAIRESNRGCYRAQCLATSRALQGALGLAPDACSTSFQSRLGRTQWIRPYTDEVVERLAAAGVRRLAVLCPAFVADCLETLEEIGIRLREQWQELGGSELVLCPCPNADPVWIDAVAAMVRRAAA